MTTVVLNIYIMFMLGEVQAANVSISAWLVNNPPRWKKGGKMEVHNINTTSQSAV